MPEVRFYTFCTNTYTRAFTCCFILRSNLASTRFIYSNENANFGRYSVAISCHPLKRSAIRISIANKLVTVDGYAFVNFKTIARFTKQITLPFHSLCSAFQRQIKSSNDAKIYPGAEFKSTLFARSTRRKSNANVNFLLHRKFCPLFLRSYSDWRSRFIVFRRVLRPSKSSRVLGYLIYVT